MFSNVYNFSYLFFFLFTLKHYYLYISSFRKQQNKKIKKKSYSVIKNKCRRKTQDEIVSYICYINTKKKTEMIDLKATITDNYTTTKHSIRFVAENLKIKQKTAKRNEKKIKKSNEKSYFILLQGHLHSYIESLTLTYSLLNTTTHSI